MSSFIKDVSFLVAPYGFSKLARLLLIMVGQIVFQTLSLLSIATFIQVLATPNGSLSSGITPWLAGFFDTVTVSDQIRVFGVSAIVMVVVASFFSIWSEYMRSLYAHDIGHWLRNRIVKALLSKNYEFFFKHSSIVLTKIVVQDVMTFVQQVLLPLFEIIVRGLFSATLLVWLFMLNPFALLAVIILVTVYYIAVFKTFRKVSKRTSDGIKQETRETYSAVGQTFSGIKAVQIANIEKFFAKRCDDPSRRLATLVPKVVLLSAVPRYLLEALVFIGLTMWILLALSMGTTFDQIISAIAIFGLILYRLGPCFQIIVAQIMTISSMRQSMEEILDLFRCDGVLHSSATVSYSDITKTDADEIQIFQHEIQFNNVSFHYQGSNRGVVDITIQVLRGTHVALVGKTGSGKSTIIDLILGLLEPTSGDIRIDGISMRDIDFRHWRDMIGYVPQDQFLLDATIAENIALGYTRETVNQALLEEVAHISGVASFIEDDLPLRYDTRIGEQGKLLSGGQKQRIAIARALYHQPKLLILDEATSALDSETESTILTNLRSLSTRPTIITVTHRLSTVSNCNHVYFLKDGGIHAKGSFQDLFEKNQKFRDLVGNQDTTDEEQ